MSASIVVAPPSLKKDKEFFSNSFKLQEGALLTDLSNNTGKVFFSLQEIPVRTKFLTQNKNILQRMNEDLVKIISEKDKCGCNIKITRKIDDTNKDILIWAQLQSDLSSIGDETKINRVGLHLKDIYTGVAIRIHSLKELKIGAKYFTENDNLLVRTGENEVTLGDKIIEISKNYLIEKFPICEANAPDCKTETPGGGNLSSSGEIDYSSTRSMMECNNFPKILKCSIEGNLHTSPFKCTVEYSGGVEGNSIIRWERCQANGSSFSPISKANSLIYQPTISDINCKVRVSYLPVRADGVAGLICYSNVLTVKVDPEIQQEVALNVSLSGFVVKVLELSGNEFQKRSIFLNEEKIKIRKKRSTTSKMNFCSDLLVYPDIDRDCCFIVEFSKEDRHEFMAPSSFQRDVIVLTIKEYNNLHSKVKS